MPDTIHLTRGAVSGLYVRREQVISSTGIRVLVADTVRLDVDGWFPLERASGLYYPHGLQASLAGPVHWVSDALLEVAAGVWEAEIRRRFPDTAFLQPSALPHTSVRIRVLGTASSVAAPKMTLTFFGGAPDVSKALEFESPYFRAAEFEFDRVEGAPHVTAIDTWQHPDHASMLPRVISIIDVYSRAGVDLRQSPNTSVIGLEAGLGADIWDDQQLHDAMRMFWSRYQPRQQWAGWVLFAHRHRDPDTNGVMFDHGKTKPNDGIHRQGAAVFGDAVADHVPPGEQHPALLLPRRRFFTAIHEMGHCFNLGHSWEKQGANPWISLGPQADALSIMNYPERVANFWKNFQYRFDDKELYFIRHAPEEFVEMGDAAWGENHGDRIPFRSGPSVSNPQLALELAVSRPQRLFEFLEPITVELKLTNTSGHPQCIDASALKDVHSLTVVIVPHAGLAREWQPYARHCYFPRVRILQPGESLRASIFVSAGVDGWHLAEPGAYSLHARLETSTGGILAEPLTVRIAAPRGWDEEYLAQDFFTDEVGRALAFGGTHSMTGAIRVLREAAERLKDRAVARHATLALGLPLMRNTRTLRLPPGQAPMSSVAADGGKFEVIKARPDEARQLLRKAMLTDRAAAIETFGQLAHQTYVENYAAWLHEAGDAAGAAEARGSTYEGENVPSSKKRR